MDNSYPLTRATTALAPRQRPLGSRMADFVGDLQPPDVPANPELEGISCDMESLCFNLIDDKLWGIGIEILVLVYAFVGVAIVADAHLVPGLETLCVRWSIPEDVAGASFMAFGSAAPEITINAISTIKAVLSGAGLHPTHPPPYSPSSHPASSLQPPPPAAQAAPQASAATAHPPLKQAPRTTRATTPRWASARSSAQA